MKSPIYIAGPMTGYPEWNFPAFHAQAKRLRDHGNEVVNPAELDEADDVAPGDRPWRWYLARDLRHLLECRSVVVLDGWRESRGASLEVYVARQLQIPVYDAETWEAPTEESILDEAARAVYGARRNDYGHPLDNHTRTAGLWSAYLGIDITPENVCFLNILQKISRSCQAITRDTLVDIAGYAVNVSMVEQERERRQIARQHLEADIIG